MTRKTLLPLIAVTAAAVVPTTAALASGSSSSPAAATAASVKIDPGFAYYDSYKPLNRKLVVVVVKTRGQLPRRFDGLIRAGGSLATHNGSSVGSVGGRASRCYTFTIPLEDGRFSPTDGSGKGAKGSPGRYPVTITAKDADGTTTSSTSSTKTITLRDRKAGDRSGKPLGC
jgi:hypothetical protein